MFRYSRPELLMAAVTLFGVADAVAKQDYYFDATLLRDTGLSNSDIRQLNQDTMVKPGTYPLDLYVNGVTVTRDDVVFSDDGSRTSPCFTWKTLNKIGLKALPKTPGPACYRPEDGVFEGVAINVALSQMRIDFSVPQALLDEPPRGSVPEESLESGESMLFLNYMANQYHVSQKQGGNDSSDSTFLNLNGGINLGLWRYREQSSLNYDTDAGSRWTTSRRYLQRALLPLKSEIMLGEGYTDGQFFSGMGFKGVQLTSDSRMRPDSQRGYAPVVRGIARTNAKVTIRQGNTTLYETTVAPGAFVIDDLYPTHYAGDLNVLVSEADGSESTFTVPFSALAESLRAGLF